MEIIAEGLAFPEGPVVMADGSVIVVETAGGRVTRCWDGKTEVICETGGGPNGLAIGPDGALWLCNNGGWDGIGRIERIDISTGKFERVYDSVDGLPLQGPNDLVFDSSGRMWFTDMGKIGPTHRTTGGAFTCLPDGSSITTLYRQSISYNGIGLSPDEKSVYVADTFQARLYRYDARAEAQDPQYIATAPGPISFDSLAVTASGNICVATLMESGVTTFTPGGEAKFTPVEGDRYLTNIAFGGDDMRDAYITLSDTGRLAQLRWDEPGLKLAFNA
ncbi:MAG: SMP-30/gluconolactonase/LRE family protein [Sphingomonadaceae bacterium]|nr:SMP-30/gluconolactonase/LRE family protein [Sphingomonadaceae bacterium]